MKELWSKLKWKFSAYKRLSKLTILYQGITSSGTVLISQTIEINVNDIIKHIGETLTTEEYPQWNFDEKILDDDKYKNLNENIEKKGHELLKRWLKQRLLEGKQRIVSSKPLIGIHWEFKSKFDYLSFEEYKKYVLKEE